MEVFKVSNGLYINLALVTTVYFGEGDCDALVSFAATDTGNGQQEMACLEESEPVARLRAYLDGKAVSCPEHDKDESARYLLVDPSDPDTFSLESAEDEMWFAPWEADVHNETRRNEGDDRRWILASSL